MADGFTQKPYVPPKLNSCESSTSDMVASSMSNQRMLFSSKAFMSSTSNTLEPLTSKTKPSTDRPVWFQSMTDSEALEFCQSDNNWPVDDSSTSVLEEMNNMRKAQNEYLANHDSPVCSELSKYNILGKIGKGTYGEVFKGSVITNNKPCVVAIKKILKSNQKEGFPLTSLREVRILKKLKHENIVILLEICQTTPNAKNNYRTTFYLIFEFCDHDLSGLLNNNEIKLKLREIKELMKQLLNGLYYIHANKILHRDLKSANVLVTKDGVLKIADFGLSRAFSELPGVSGYRYTNCVVTLWYRSPELLLGDLNYGPPIDLWAAGCIMAEMFTSWPIMRGHTDQGQLNEILKVCGPIDPEQWPNVKKLRLYKFMLLPKCKKQKAKDYLNKYTNDKLACDLFDKLLTYDPLKRINADSALNHDFFWSDPMPCRKRLAKKMNKIHGKNFEYLKIFSKANTWVKKSKISLPF